MTDKEAIDDFKNIVEESRIEDRTEYYIKLRNTLDVLENQNNRITELEQIEADHQKTNGELREELKKKEEWIHTMQAEFDRLEGIEDNTAMLKYEKEQLEKSLCEHDEIIARLEEENTKLKDKNKYLEIRASELNGLADIVERDYIPKTKIKEKIEKLEEE